MRKKFRCPGCHRQQSASYILCDLCQNRVPPPEREDLFNFIRDYWKPDRNAILMRWLAALVQAVQFDRLAERRLILNTIGPKNRIFPHVS